MAKHIAKGLKRTRWGVCVGGWALSCLVSFLAVGFAPAQEFIAQPPRARQMLKAARELYAKGEYEAADQYYRQAYAGKDWLTTTERQDLNAQMQQNATALRSRQEGAQLLQQTQEALQAGKVAEADATLRQAQANPFLSPLDKQQLAQLTQGLNQLRAGQIEIDPKADAKTLLHRAREALQRGDLTTAEMLARQAEKSRSFMSTMVFWGDTPGRVLDDVRAARTRLTASKKEEPIAAQVPTVHPIPSPGDQKAVVTNYTPGDGGEREKVKAQARQLIFDGYKALSKNDVTTARNLANQARDLKPDLQWHEQNPDKLLADIRQAETNQTAAAAPPDARILLRQARSLFLQQHYDEADKLAAQAEAVPGSRWGYFEDSPRRLREEIARTRSQIDQDRANKLTIEARTALKQNNLVEARALATQAKQLQGQPSSRWKWSDTPEAVLRDVARLEKTNPQVPAAAVAQTPAPAPAPANPMVVASTPPTVSVPTNPNLPAPPPDIAAVVGHPTNVTPTGGLTPELAAVPQPVTFESAQAKMQTRTRALTLLAEARTLEKQGHLAEARAKALEAEQLHGTWAEQEESPSAVLRDLDTRCNARIRQLLDQAHDTVTKNPSDPARFERADAYLLTARRLAESFRQDTAPIDQKIQWLHQVAIQSSQTRLESTASNPVLESAQLARQSGGEEASEPERRDGSEKLEQARRELRAGNTTLARKLAEDVFFVPALRKDAEAVLRTIDAEEHGQTVLAAQRNYTAGLEAFAHKDYRKAAALLGTVDIRLLGAEKSRRVAEVMETAEMRSAGIPAAPLSPVAASAPGAKDGAGKASVGDLDDPQLAQFRQMEQIQFDKYRGMKLGAEQRAGELARTGQEDEAVKTLEDYLAHLRGSGMEAGSVTRLATPVEDRIGKLRTELAKKEFERERKAAAGKPHDESEYLSKKTKTQEKVADLIQRGNLKMKEGKYDEALAEAIKAHDLDPDNSAARALQYVATMKMRKEEYEKNQIITEKMVIDMLNPEPVNAPTSRDPVVMNKDVFNKALTRRDNTVQSLLAKSPKELWIERKLLQPIDLNFNDMPLYRVLQDLQLMTDINIVPNRAALADKNISLEQPLSLKVDKISLKSALDILLRQVRLTWVIKGEYIEITTLDQTQGKKRMVTYAIADLVIPVDDKETSQVNSFEEALKRHINHGASGVQYNSPTPFVTPTGLGNAQPVSQGASGHGAGGQMSPPIWTKNGSSHTIENVLINLITNTISPESWASSGGEGTIQYYPLGHALVIGQVQEVQEEVQALLNALRRLQDIQISIEMRVVGVSESFFERMGLDFDVNFRTPTSRNETQLLTGNFAPFNQVNRNLGVSNTITGLTPAGTLTPDLNIPIKNSSFDFSVPAFGGYPGALGASGGLSLGLAFLSDIQVFMFLEAAQGDRRSHIMQAPKITVFNGQTANINVQDVMFFVTTVAVVQAGAQTFFVPQNNPFPIGVGMQVTPVVSADRRFVRVNLQPQLSNLISPNIPLIPVQIPIPQVFDGPGGSGVVAGQPVIFQMFFQQPAFTSVTISTTVNVPDGGTVLLGGMKTLAESRNEFGPPILSKIPYLSRLFRNTAWGRDTQSIMILVTPRVIINEEIEQEVLGTMTPIPR